MATGTFAIGDIITAATGRYATRNGLTSVAALLTHMTGEQVLTHQMPRVSEECAADLYRQHPDLAGITVPQFTSPDEGLAWLAGIEAVYGTHRDVEPLADPNDHTSIHPVAELRMLRGDAPIVVVTQEP